MSPSAMQEPSALCHIVTPVGCLGYGLDEDVCDAELARLRQESDTPIAIILDAGSTDSGPARLALGQMAAPRSNYARDLTKLLRLCNKYNTPLLFSSAGGDGADDHVNEMTKVISEVVEQSKEKYQTKIITIKTEVPKNLIKERLSGGKVTGCGPAVPTLTERDVEDAVRIVAQVGAEPFLDAMFADPDFNVIVGGRAYDPSPFVAYCSYVTMKSASGKVPLETLPESVLGGFFHMGKIMECGAQCATPKTRAARSTVYDDGTFDVTPLEKGVQCTPLAVAAHTLYEKSRPDLLYGPGGCLDLSNTSYEALADQKTVRCRGATFKPIRLTGNNYNVKLEGAKVAGYRSMFIGAYHDPALTSQLDHLLDDIRAYVTKQHAHVTENCQDVATTVVSTARVACIHAPYPGQKATSGNMAFGIAGKTDIECGPCPQFCVYHLMELESGEEGSIQDGSFQGPALFRRDQISLGLNSRPPPLPSRFGNDLKLSNEIPSKSGATGEQTSAPAITAAKRAQTPTTLGEVAKVVRSKNSGPYEITFDLLFDSEEEYHSIKKSEILSKKVISDLYSIPEEDVIYAGFFDQARAFKATIPRMAAGKRSVSGAVGDGDVHGSQHYMPLVRLRLPDELCEALR
uniref:Caib baif family enzyme n=1 Tax=Bionectria ochroleuca TaxID=29856 RepID=A0A0B7K8D5_BIOOC